MEKAVARIAEAIDREEQIVVYGDFDADGVTATVLLVEALRGLGLPRTQVRPYIPDRVDEGYGLNADALATLRAAGAGLLISVDCGIRAWQEVEAARAVGLDVIVSDHHSLGRRLPEAYAVINPKRPESAYPERMLAGVGIAYKLAQALRRGLPERASFSEESLLDLVALGTVADLAPLLGENRRLVTEGLAVLNSCRRPGIAALANVAAIKPGQMTAEHIGFGLGPRINAAGRLAHAYDAAKLLATDNPVMAQQYARELNDLNKKRRALTRSLGELADTLVDGKAPILIAAHTEFVSGVVGLVASRLAERHYRPAIVMEQGAAESRGSCRSIPGFHITAALDEVADLLERHGGHAQAAGFTLRNENLPAFEERLTHIAAERLESVELSPVLAIDAELPLQEIDWALQGQLALLEPTGQANATPVFMSRGVQVYQHRAVGSDGAHLQLEVTDGKHGLRCIAFRQGAWAGNMPPRVDIAYTVGVNEWNGRRNLQLVVQDIRAATET
jgi:single-stranded-DNA-specific exonuclease